MLVLEGYSPEKTEPVLLRFTGFILLSKSDEEFLLASPKLRPSLGLGRFVVSILETDGAGEDFLAKGLKTLFLSFFAPNSPFGLVSIADVPLVSGLRLELLD